MKSHLRKPCNCLESCMNMFMSERYIYICLLRVKGHSSESKTPLLENGKSIKFQNGYILQI